MKKIINYLLIMLFGLFIFINNPQSIFASSASISVSASSSKVVVGKTFYVYFKISSSSKIGTVEFSPSYDKSVLKLVSGNTHVYDYDIYGKKSKTYTYKFKAISSGSSKITVKSYELLDFDTKKMPTSISSKTVKIITQSQLEASYSKNNDLASLKIEGLKLSPKFDDNTLKYTAQAEANTTKIKIKASTEDSKAKVSGTGSKSVSEGENKFKIVVTAENGSTKTYTVIVNVVDPNPIEVLINDQKYTLVKRESNLESVDDYKKKIIKINNQSIPSLFNEENNITLVGLKNSEGDVKLFIYNETDNSYKEYSDITLSKIRILPLNMDKTIDSYTLETIEINSSKVEALNVNDHIYIIKARNFDTVLDDYFFYDKDNNTIIKYYESNDKEPIIINNSADVKAYKKIIMLLGIETVVIIFILICILISKMKKNKRKREYLQKKIEEEKKRKEEVEKLQNEIKNLEAKKTTKTRSKKKEVSNSESKKKK